MKALPVITALFLLGPSPVLAQVAPRTKTDSAVRLDTLTVTGDTSVHRKRIPGLADQGFNERMRRGFGYFLTRNDIESKSPVIMSDVLQGIPGVQVTCLSR